MRQREKTERGDKKMHTKRDKGRRQTDRLTEGGVQKETEREERKVGD